MYNHQETIFLFVLLSVFSMACSVCTETLRMSAQLKMSYHVMAMESISACIKSTIVIRLERFLA